MAASGAPARQPRRGPAPFASFDHDGSDESSPESKVTARLPEIREGAVPAEERLALPDQRARSHSTPAVGALAAPTAPRIDISRASSSSHHDSRDSSPELALFAGVGGEDRARLELGFREDGALDLRSSTEELTFLEPAPGEAPPPRPASAAPAPATYPPSERRHSRKDSQCSEAALLGVSGRTSRLSSVGSQCSAQSALSRVSRLSVVSGASRSPSPHRMLLETSFCGPKPIETDPEISAGALVEQILGIVHGEAAVVVSPIASPPVPSTLLPAPIDARDRREVRTEVTVESARSVPITPTVTVVAPPPLPSASTVDHEKNEKEEKNRTRTEGRKARPRIRREPSEPEVYKPRNKTKDVIRIKLRPDDSYEEEEDSTVVGTGEAARKPATLELAHAARPAAPAPPSPSPSRRRSPSPAGPPVSRKSSFCSLFKSRETIASPESPSEALRRKRSLTEGRSRSKSRDRSATPTSGNKIRGSVLSLFRTPRRSGASPSPGSREGSPVVQGAHPPSASVPPERQRADKLKYYEDTKDGIIHIPLRTPPDEQSAVTGVVRRSSGVEPAPTAETIREPRPASAPQPRALPNPVADPEPRFRAEMQQRSPLEPQPRPSSSEPRSTNSSRLPSMPIHRTVLPDGSIIIPLHSPTEKPFDDELLEISRVQVPKPTLKPAEEPPIIHQTEPPVDAVSPTSSANRDSTKEISLPKTHTEGSSVTLPEESGAPEPPASTEESRSRRKERLVFTTHVGSREQVFSTQFSITKTPSITSEISGSFPSFEGEVPPLRDTHIAEPSHSALTPATPATYAGAFDSGAVTPAEGPRDSSESEPSSEAAPSRVGNDVEKRVLVVQQESFEEELPYVPTTLPQERSVALPMVPVRERGGVNVSSTQRPRAAAPPVRAPPPPSGLPAAQVDKLRIKLPRRPRPADAAAAPRTDRSRTRSGGDSSGGESRSKAEWIDFEEVPERRKQPKRIQTVPAAAAGGGGVVFSYVEPEHCRCECHTSAPHQPHQDEHTPLLRQDLRASIISSSSAECGDSEPLSQEGVVTPGPERGS